MPIVKFPALIASVDRLFRNSKRPRKASAFGVFSYKRCIIIEKKKNVTVNGKATTGSSADGSYTFTVKDADGNLKTTVTVTITDGKSSEVQVDDLLPWSYTVTEDTSKNPEGMALVGKNGVEVTVEANSTADVPTAEFTNDRTEETVSIPVEKRWEGKAGKSVTVKLLADGDVVREITLSASNNWKHVFADLPKHDSSDGHEIIYTVSEDEVAGYTTAISGDAAAGFVITNKETPPPPPDTGDHSDALLYFGMMFVSVMGIILALTGKRKKIRN